MVLNEWKHKELHRDVRIVIVEIAIQLIRSGAASDDVWAILRSAATEPHIDPKVKVAVIGTKPAAPAYNPSVIYHQVQGSTEQLARFADNVSSACGRLFSSASSRGTFDQLIQQLQTVTEKGEWELPQGCSKQVGVAPHAACSSLLRNLA